MTGVTANPDGLWVAQQARQSKLLTSGIVNRRKVLGGTINDYFDYFRASGKPTICPT
ncbi:MAG: hypothetical protein GY805_32835 [Chloroflexi bacterium]|nr:hypothetical protein [Chloroflexota bacterium]